MTFNRPPDITYTQMAMDFDKTFYTEARDDTKLFQYMYHLVYMLACKKNFFVKWADYDQFALYVATRMYIRFLRQEKLGNRYKSVLNYLKSVIKHEKKSYQNETYKEVINPIVNHEAAVAAVGIKVNLQEAIQADYNDGLDVDIMLDLQELPILIQEQLDKLPFKTDKLLTHRLYISCLLTFLSNITLDNKTLSKVEELKPYKIVECLAKYKKEPSILWHLDKSYDSYVKLILNKVRVEMAKRINDDKLQYQLPDDVIDSILTTAYSTYGLDQSEDC